MRTIFIYLVLFLNGCNSNSSTKTIHLIEEPAEPLEFCEVLDAVFSDDSLRYKFGSDYNIKEFVINTNWEDLYEFDCLILKENKAYKLLKQKEIDSLSIDYFFITDYIVLNSDSSVLLGEYSGLNIGLGINVCRDSGYLKLYRTTIYSGDE